MTTETEALNYEKKPLVFIGDPNKGEQKEKDYKTQKSNAPLPQKNAKPKLLVTRKVEEGDIGLEQDILPKSKNVVPMSLLTANHVGPQRGEDGHILPYTLLGDIDDYEEMARLEHKEEDVSQDIFKAQAFPITKQEEAEPLKQDDIKAIEKTDENIKRRILKSMHIFQRYRELRQEHALDNWMRHSIQWQKMEHSIAKTIDTDKDSLVMSKVLKYRMMVEDQELIEEAMKVLEHGGGKEWKTMLNIGDELLGIHVPMPLGGPREIERLLHRPLKPTKYKEYRNEYKEYRIQQLKPVLSVLDPFYLNPLKAEYIEVVGKNAMPKLSNLAEEYAQRLEEKISPKAREESDRIQRPYSVLSKSSQARSRASSRYQVNSESYNGLNGTSGSVQAMGDGLDEGIHLVLATSTLSFESLTDQVASSVVTLYNKGSVAVRFEWETEMLPNTLNTKAIHDGVQRFFSYHKSGMVQPGMAFDFLIMFKSREPGIFKEVWKLNTLPDVYKCVEPMELQLQGIAVKEDKNYHKREELLRWLDTKAINTLCKQIVEHIMTRVNLNISNLAAQKPSALKDLKSWPSLHLCPSKEEIIFNLRNKEHNISFSFGLYNQLCHLYNEMISMNPKLATTQWDSSLDQLNELINQMVPPEVKSQYIMKLNTILHSDYHRAPLQPRQMIFAIWWDVMCQMVDRVSSTSEQLRNALRLPNVRPCTQKFIETEDTLLKNDSEQDGLSTPGKNIGSARKLGTPGSVAALDEKPRKGGGPNPVASNLRAPSTKELAVSKKSGAKQLNQQTKGGKRDPHINNVLKEDEASHRVITPKVKPQWDSRSSWSVERKQNEEKYKKEFKTLVLDLVSESISNAIALCEK